MMRNWVVLGGFKDETMFPTKGQVTTKYARKYARRLQFKPNCNDQSMIFKINQMRQNWTALKKKQTHQNNLIERYSGVFVINFGQICLVSQLFLLIGVTGRNLGYCLVFYFKNNSTLFTFFFKYLNIQKRICLHKIQSTVALLRQEYWNKLKGLFKQKYSINNLFPCNSISTTISSIRQKVIRSLS